MRKIMLALLLALLAHADHPPAVCMRHDIADLLDDGATLAVAFARVRAAAGDAEIRLEEKAIELDVPVAVHERIAQALREVREGRGKVVTLEVQVVKLEGAIGAAEVAADKLDAFLREKHADRIALHAFPCRNLCKASVGFAREIPYVPDFDVECGVGGVTVRLCPAETAREVWTAKFEPLIAGRAVRVAAEFSVTEIAMGEFTSCLADTMPTIGVPEERPRTIRRTLDCTPDRYAVVDLDRSVFALVRATVAPAR